MKRRELEEAIRHATAVTEQREVLVIGSQAILGSYDETQLPERATLSEEVDIAPITDDEDYTLATLIDANLGSGRSCTWITVSTRRVSTSRSRCSRMAGSTAAFGWHQTVPAAHWPDAAIRTTCVPQSWFVVTKRTLSLWTRQSKPGSSIPSPSFGSARSDRSPIPDTTLRSSARRPSYLHCSSSTMDPGTKVPAIPPPKTKSHIPDG